VSVSHTHVNRRTANILPADGKTCGVHFVFAMVMMMVVLMTRIRARDSLLERACLACYYTHHTAMPQTYLIAELSGDNQTLRYIYLLWW
jgi:hypothetical protein